MLKSLHIFTLGICLVAWTLFAPAAKAADSFQHGHDCASAKAIGLGTQKQDALADTEDRAVYRIVLNQRGLFEVWIEPGNFDISHTELLDSSCKNVEGVSGGLSVLTGNYSSIAVPHSLSSFFPNSAWTLAPGEYFIRFVADPMLVSGWPFIFHNRFIEHAGHDCATAVPVTLPFSIESAILFPEDRQVFQISLPAAAQIHFWTTGTLPSRLPPFVDSRFSDCSSGFEVENDDGTGVGAITDRLEAGTYYVAVEPDMPDSMGPFTLHIAVVQAGESISPQVQIPEGSRPKEVVNELRRKTPVIQVQPQALWRSI